MSETAVPVANARNTIGEGPRWHSGERALYWVDFIDNQHICRWSPSTQQLEKHEVPAPITALGFRRNGGLVVAAQGLLSTYEIGSGAVRPLATVEQGAPMRLNDGATDARGRFWVGSMNASTPETPQGSLYRCTADGAVTRMDTGFTVSNGLGWSPDAKTFYFVDTFRYVLHAYDFDAEAGTISNRRDFARFDPSEGTPDGLTVDAKGHVWIALWGGWKVIRLTPDGRREREIRLPVSNPTACTFGGDNLDELYITTARLALSPEELDNQPLAGDLFVARPGVCGQNEPWFGD